MQSIADKNMDHNTVGFWAGISALIAAILGGLMALLRLVNKPIDLKLDHIREKVEENTRDIKAHHSRFEKIERVLGDHIAREDEQWHKIVEEVSKSNAERDSDLIDRVIKSLG